MWSTTLVDGILLLYASNMGFWTAIVGIVTITLAFDFLKKTTKAKRGDSALQEQLAAQSARTSEIESQMAALSAENASLKVALEEQRILADEAVSTYGSRMERLQREQAAAASLAATAAAAAKEAASDDS
jgi:predicted RNase H-like nuclease (RuvC/YqgF family)